MSFAGRLVLLASGLVVLTALGVGGMLTASALSDLETAQRDRGLAVARDFAHRAQPALLRGDRAALTTVLRSGFEVDGLARVEIANVMGRVLASQTFDAHAALKPTARAVTGPPDADGIREAIGYVKITLTTQAVQAQRRAYLMRAAWTTGGIAVVGLGLAIGLGLRLARPLQQVAQAADAVAAGTYGDATDLPAVGSTEVRRLATAFSHAVAAVADREQRLKTLNADLRRTQSERDAMTHMLVHDLKGPLGNVVTLMSILQTATLDVDDLELVEEGRARCEDLLALIGDLLDVGRLEYGQLTLAQTQLAPADLVAAAVRSVQHLAEARQVEIRVGDVPETPIIQGDARILQRVIVNLILNGIRHGRSPIEIDTAIKAQTIELTVRDAGSGPPADRLAEIFEPYASGAGGERRGSGLGLAFVKLAVQAHGGRVGVVGSSFSVHLPTVHV